MKRLLIVFLSFAIFVSTFIGVSFASDSFTRVEGVYEIENFDYTQVVDCSLYKSGTEPKFNIRKDAIGEEGIKYLLDVFSDKNLNCILFDITDYITPANTPDFPKNGIDFTYKIKNGNYYTFVFDEKHVWYNFNITTDDGIIVFKEGLFEFADTFVYDNLAEKIDEWRLNQEEINKQNEADRKKNPVSVSDFEIIYEARARYLDNDFVFGVCSYKRNETTVTTLYYLLFDTDSRKILKIIDAIPSENTFTTECNRLLEFDGNYSGGVEYDNTLGPSWTYKVQINVNSSYQVDDMLIMSKTPSTEYGNENYIDMSYYTQIGSLPSDWFSAADNTQYPNKLKYFEKLYSEKITTHHGVVIDGVKKGEDREWGICKYSNDLSGEVHAFYLYDKSIDRYYISEIDEVYYNKEIDNVITFDKTRVIYGELELYDEYMPNTDHFMLRLGINQNKEIYRRSFLVDYGSDKKFLSCTILDTKYLSGSLDSLNLEDYFTSDSYISSLEKEEDAEKIPDSKDDEADTAGKDTENKTDVKAEDEKESVENKEEKNEQDTEEKTETEVDDEKEPVENKENDEKVMEEIEIKDFIDVPPSHWAYNEIKHFSENGIVLGYGNGYFGVDDPITYEHFALLLERLFNYDEDDTQPVPALREDVIVSVVKALSIDVSNADTSIIGEKFTDCSQLQEKNLKYIAKATELGLVVGSYGKLYPRDNLTRAETVMLLYRAINY